jgi:hypothetical protein
MIHPLLLKACQAHIEDRGIIWKAVPGSEKDEVLKSFPLLASPAAKRLALYPPLILITGTYGRRSVAEEMIAVHPAFPAYSPPPIPLPEGKLWVMLLDTSRVVIVRSLPSLQATAAITGSIPECYGYTRSLSAGELHLVSGLVASGVWDLLQL